jgi:Transposase IS66 family
MQIDLGQLAGFEAPSYETIDERGRHIGVAAPLTRFLDDGRLCMSNAAERELRAVPVGRRKRTFAGSDEGGRRAAAPADQAAQSQRPARARISPETTFAATRFRRNTR